MADQTINGLTAKVTPVDADEICLWDTENVAPAVPTKKIALSVLKTYMNIPDALADLSDDETHRTVTDTEKSTWNAKADTGDIPTALSELSDDSTHRVVTDTEKALWNLGRAITFQVIDGATALATGDGKAYIRIPSTLNGFNVTGVADSVVVKSTSGTISVQIARGRQANATSDFTYVDVLSTLLTIDANEYDSKDATTAAVINAANDDLATGDLLRVDVDGAGTGTKGLNISIICEKP